MAPYVVPSLPDASSSVYLVDESATGQAAASNTSNQQAFLRLMGLIENEPISTSDNPIPLEELQLLAVAGNHIYLDTLNMWGSCDGYIHVDSLNESMKRRLRGDNPSCGCVAHLRVGDPLTPTEEERQLKWLIRAPLELKADSGSKYVIAILQRILSLLQLDYQVEISGSTSEVSYCLLRNGEKHCFRGYPDFLINKEDTVGAGHRLVATGEIQSTDNPHVQNAIYGVGSLKRTSATALVVITVLKWKLGLVAIARIDKSNIQNVSTNVLERVTLNHVVSPYPASLITVEGLRDFSTRLQFALDRVESCSPPARQV